jgi:hypothetical protein
VLKLALNDRRKERETKGRGEGVEGRPIGGWRKSENKPIKTYKSYQELRRSVKIRQMEQKVKLNQLKI